MTKYDICRERNYHRWQADNGLVNIQECDEDYDAIGVSFECQDCQAVSEVIRCDWQTDEGDSLPDGTDEDEA